MFLWRSHSRSIILFILIVSFLFFIFLSLRALVKRIYYRKNMLQRKRIFNDLYANIDGIDISKNARAKLETDSDGLVYGEICFDSFSEVLAVAQPKPTDVFYDLGSGTGKAVFCSALLYTWKKCCGIELLSDLHKTSINQLEKWNISPEIKLFFPNKILPIEFIQSDFLEVDFHDATIVFINATSFTAEFWQLVINKLNTLQRGTRIIVASKKLEPLHYELLDARMCWMNWGWSSVYIYQKIV